MSTQDNGGPAHSHLRTRWDSDKHEYVLDESVPSELTMRDHFAAKALQGCLPLQTVFSDELAKRGGSDVDLCEFMAAMAYRYADAMLKARQS